MKKYSILYFLLGVTTAAYLPYAVMFLNEISITPRTIGLIVSLSAVVKIGANPFWGYITDRIGSVKKVFIICLITSALLIQLYLVFESVYAIAGLFLLVALFVNSMIPLMDNWILQGIKDKDSKGYGYIRIWPCIAFALSAFLLGRLIEATTVYALFPVFGVFALITLLFALSVKNNDMSKGNRINIRCIKKIFSDRPYLMFLLFCFLFYVPITASYTFFPLLMDSVGSTKSQFGLSIFMMSICEVPIYLVGKRLLQRIKPVKIILLATAFFSLTLLFYSLATDPIHIILTQAIRGAAQALFMFGFLYYLDQLAPVELKATYLTVAVSVYSGISGMVGSLLGGWMIEEFDIQKMFLIGSFMCFTIAGLFLISVVVNDLKYIQRKVN